MAASFRNKETATYRIISQAEFGKLADSLAEQITSSGLNFDLIIGIKRGGEHVAKALSERLGIERDCIRIESYNGVYEREKPRITEETKGSVAGKHILVVDDLIDEGNTLELAEAHLLEKGASRLETAVLFRKPWSRIRPNFCLEITTNWIVFPWEPLPQVLRDGSNS